jgi:Toprim domain
MIDVKDFLDQLDADDLRAIIEHIVPYGEWDRDGKQYYAASIQGGEGRSFNFNLDKKIGGDWADNEKMTDVLGLWQRAKGCDFKTAVQQLSVFVGAELEDMTEDELIERREKRKADAEERARLRRKMDKWDRIEKYYCEQLQFEKVKVMSVEEIYMKAEFMRYQKALYESYASKCLDAYDWVSSMSRLYNNVDAQKEIAKWRGLEVGFVHSLARDGHIGLSPNGEIEFPVQDQETGFVTCVHRLVIKEDGDKFWYYSEHDKETETGPLIINWRKPVQSVVIGESQWDVLSFLLHGGGDRGIATRGAKNVKKLDLDQIPADATIYVMCQNDHPGRVWLHDLCDKLNRLNVKVWPPKQHKDVNDWLRTPEGRFEMRAEYDAFYKKQMEKGAVNRKCFKS